MSVGVQLATYLRQPVVPNLHLRYGHFLASITIYSGCNFKGRNEDLNHIQELCSNTYIISTVETTVHDNNTRVNLMVTRAVLWNNHY